MANLNEDFDASTVEPEVGFDPIPAGKYVGMVVDSDVKNNSKNTGTLLSLKFQIIEGNFKGRNVFGNINLTNSNQTAQNIGRGVLSSLCRSTGVMKTNDSSNLHNIPVLAKVSYSEASGQYGANNGLESFEPAGAAGAGAVQQQAPAIQQPVQPTQNPVQQPVQQAVQQPMQQPVQQPAPVQQVQQPAQAQQPAPMQQQQPMQQQVQQPAPMQQQQPAMQQQATPASPWGGAGA